MQDQPVHRRGGEAQRLDEIDHQHDPDLIRPVPRFMFEAVIEDQRLAFLPPADLVPDPDRQFFFSCVRHEEPKM